MRASRRPKRWATFGPRADPPPMRAWPTCLRAYATDCTFGGSTSRGETVDWKPMLYGTRSTATATTNPAARIDARRVVVTDAATSTQHTAPRAVQRSTLAVARAAVVAGPD